MRRPRRVVGLEPVQVVTVGVIDTDVWNAVEGVLDDADRAMCERMRRSIDRERRLVTRGLLRLAIARWSSCEPADVEITTGPHGRPLVAVPTGTAPHVSVSHTDGCSIVALSAGRVGVDVEPARRSVGRDVGARICSPSERRALASIEPGHDDAALLRTWVRKEAALKLDGRGLAVDPRSLDVRSPRVRLPAGGRWRRAHLHDVDVGPDHVAAVAWLGRRGAPRVSSGQR